MAFDSTTSAPWLTRAKESISAGFHLVVAGNTSDLFAVDRVPPASAGDTVGLPAGLSWLPAREALFEVLRHLEYEIFAGTALSENIEAPADRAVRWKEVTLQVEQSKTIEERSDRVSRISKALLSNECSMGVVIENCDRFFGRDDAGMVDQVRLARAMSAAKLAGPRNLRNVLILVASGGLSEVPGYLYRDNNHVAVVEVAHPNRLERERYLRPSLTRFYGCGQMSEDDKVRTLARLVDLSDSMSIRMLEGMIRLSVANSVDVATEPKRLVDLFKYGKKTSPWRELTLDKVRSAQAAIEKVVIGQPQAVRAVSRTLKHARMGIGSDGRGQGPRDVLLFAGTTGTGKTETAKQLAEVVFGDAGAMTRLDMSEYSQEHAVERLTGAPPGYVGFEQGGQLTNAVRSRPHQLILLDEIEKAEPRIWDRLLQVLEDGRLTDGRGQTAYFENTILVFTSNLGVNESFRDRFCKQIESGSLPLYCEIQAHVRGEIRKYFRDHLKRPEVLGRISDERIVVFDILRPDAIEKIARKFLDGFVQSACASENTVDIRIGDSVVEHIRRCMLMTDNLLEGGRRIRTLIRNDIEFPLTDWLSDQNQSTGMRIDVSVPIDDPAVLQLNRDRVSMRA